MATAKPASARIGGTPQPSRHRWRRLITIAVFCIALFTFWTIYVQFDYVTEVLRPLKGSPPFSSLSGATSQIQEQLHSDASESAVVDITGEVGEESAYRPVYHPFTLQANLSDTIGPFDQDSGPSPHSGQRRYRRLVIVGDVHGSLGSFRELLARTRFSAARGDHVVLAGDMVNKGPDSPGVIQLAMEMGASAVRGNHEDRILRVWEELERKKRGNKHELNERQERDEEIDLVDKKGSKNHKHHETHKDKSRDRDIATVQSLTADQMAWIANLPIILNLGDVPSLGQAVIVHAGLVPLLPIENQDPWAVMNMRTLRYHSSHKSHKLTESDDIDSTSSESDLESMSTLRIARPLKGRHGHSWSKAWNKAQKYTAADQRLTVVYGHDARSGLHVRPYAIGLDSACVYDGRLSALVIDLRSEGARGGTVDTSEEIETVEMEGVETIEVKGGRKRKIVSVKCKKQQDFD